MASASSTKLADNQLLADLIQALGCGTGTQYRDQDLRYEKVVIMTDADVDGAHIASLLITFFYQEMRGLIDNGHLYLAVPPLYRLSQGAKTAYARDDAHKAELLKSEFNGRGKVDVSRFKGLGEMLPKQLKETTMDRSVRTLLRVEIAEDDRAAPARSSISSWATSRRRASTSSRSAPNSPSPTSWIFELEPARDAGLVFAIGLAELRLQIVLLALDHAALEDRSAPGSAARASRRWSA